MILAAAHARTLGVGFGNKQAAPCSGQFPPTVPTWWGFHFTANQLAATSPLNRLTVTSELD
jgi:hypothetical protein